MSEDTGLPFFKLILGGLGFERFQWYRGWVGGGWEAWDFGSPGKEQRAWYRIFSGDPIWGVPPDRTEHWPPLPEAKENR